MLVISDPSVDIVTTAYHDLLVPNFPADELVGLDDMFSPDTKVRVALVGDVVAGVFVCDVFGGGRIALCSYLAVRPRMSGNRLGHAILMRLMQEAGEYDLVLGEVEVPQEVAARVSDSARQRVMFFQRFGLSALDIPYFQPAVTTGRPRIEEMMLVLVRACESSIENSQLIGTDLRTFIHEYIVRAEGTRGLDDGDSIALLAAASRAVGIVPLADRIHEGRRPVVAA